MVSPTSSNRLRQAGQFMATPRGARTPGAGKVASETFGTFMTSGGEGVLLGDPFSEDLLLEELKAAADAALRPKSDARGVKSENWEERQTRPGSGHSVGRDEGIQFQRCADSNSKTEIPISMPQQTWPAESAFLQSLRAAHLSAVVAGDLEAAKAVEDAIRAEGGVVPPRTTQPPSKLGLVSEHRAGPSTRPAECPRDNPPRPRLATKPVDAGCADFKARRTRMQNLLTAQLGANVAACNKPKCQTESGHRAGHTAEKEEPCEYELDSGDDSECQGPMRLGGMACAPSSSSAAALFLKADKARIGRQRWASKAMPGLNIQTEGTLSASSTESLPPSELPSCCRAAVSSWAAGRSSGYRCLLKLASNLPPTAALPTVPGICSWQGLLSVAGLSAGEEFFASRGKPSFFAMAPSKCMRNAVHDVRLEAGLAEDACLTLEELHLGLRSLELRARAENSAWLQAVAGRELLHAKLEGGQFSQDEEMEMADIMAAALSLGEQSPDQLRQLPDGLEACRSTLTALARLLREELESVRTYGPYAALGVECDAPDSAIRRAYRDLCLRHHPDKGGDTAAFQNLQQAHEQIMDDRRKGIRPAKPNRPAAKPNRPADPSPSPPRADEPRPARSPGKAQKSRSPSREPKATTTSAEVPSQSEKRREESQMCKDELLLEVGRLRQQGSEAAERSHCAAEAVRAASLFEEDFAKHAMETLLRAFSEVVESSADAASTASNASSRILAAGVLGDDGDQAEEIMAVSLHCAEASASCADASAAASALGRQASEALQVAKEADTEDRETSASVALGLLAAARRCTEAAATAAKAASAAAEAIATAEAAAEAALTGGSSSRSRKSSNLAGSMPEKQAHPSGYPSSSGWEQRGDSEGHAARDEPWASQNTTAGESSPGSHARRGAPEHGPHRRSSSGTRERNEAHARRRLETLKELETLNTEVLKLQRELLSLLLASPLLLPQTSQKQRARVFAVVAEIFLEVVDGRTAMSLLEQLGGNPSVALCNSWAGIIRLAALLDMETLSELLKGQLLPRLVATQPECRAALDTAAAQTLESLRNWVSGK